MLPYLLAGFVGLAALMMSLIYAMKRLRESGEIIAKAAARQQMQSERVRRVAHACLELRREIAAARRRQANMEMACAETEERLKAVGVESKRMMVLDERRSKADPGWVVKVANPDYASRVNNNLESLALDAWRKGRRYVLWAADETKAREKVHARFPEARGFYIQGVEKYQR